MKPRTAPDHFNMFLILLLAFGVGLICGVLLALPTDSSAPRITKSEAARVLLEGDG